MHPSKGHFHRIFDTLKVACSKDFRICKTENFNILHQIEVLSIIFLEEDFIVL